MTVISLAGAAAPPERAEPQPCPLLGLYTVGPGGATRCYAGSPLSGRQQRWLTLTEKGEAGCLHGLAKLAGPAGETGEAILPGEPARLMGSQALIPYRARLHKPGQPAARVDLGAVLRGRPRVSRTAREGEFLLREGRKTYLLAFCLSGEGLHIRCLQFPSRKTLEHYYFYLGYEVEPTCGDLDE